jgi:excisionase family DNA binding protein
MVSGSKNFTPKVHKRLQERKMVIMSVTIKERQDYPPMMTVEEVAEALRVHTSTVYELVRSKKLPAKKLGGTIRIDRDKFFEGESA